METPRNITALLAVLLVIAWTGAARGEKSGKDIFLERKCTKCHSIESQGIVKKEEKGEGEEEEEEFSMEEEEEKKIEPPDLSGTGKDHDAEWLTKWLQKKIENKEGRKHRQRFKGDAQELKTLVEFLSSLKEKSLAEGK